MNTSMSNSDGKVCEHGVRAADHEIFCPGCGEEGMDMEVAGSLRPAMCSPISSEPISSELISSEPISSKPILSGQVGSWGLSLRYFLICSRRDLSKTLMSTCVSSSVFGLSFWGVDLLAGSFGGVLLPAAPRIRIKKRRNNSRSRSKRKSPRIKHCFHLPRAGASTSKPLPPLVDGTIGTEEMDKSDDLIVA